MAAAEQQQVLQIRAAAELLGLPQTAACTAIMLLRRAVAVSSEPISECVAACLFLACKIEEAPVRTNDLLNAVECLSSPASQAIGAAFPCLPSPQAGPSRGQEQASIQPLVAARYYAAKARLLRAEQVVLRLTNFQLSFQHPHKYLLNMARAVQCPAANVQLAVCLVNDAIVHCKCCLQSSSAAVAGACLHLANLLSGEPYALQPGWQACLGLTEAETGALGADILTAVTQSRPS